MKCKASVTFEFDTRPPVTAKIPEIEAFGVHTIASRAINCARKRLRPVGCSSMVCLVERVEGDEEAGAEG